MADKETPETPAALVAVNRRVKIGPKPEDLLTPGGDPVSIDAGLADELAALGAVTIIATAADAAPIDPATKKAKGGAKG